MSVIRIAIVDDHRVVAHSLKTYLESFPDLQVVGLASSGEELLEHLEEWNPQIVIQDLLLPGGLDGIETTRRVRQHKGLRPHVIALTASTDEARLMGVLRAGASGYVRKDADPEVLLAAVRAVARGKTYVDPTVRIQIADATQEVLTQREMDVLRYLALGRSNKEIASALGVGEETVKTHVGNVLGKLGVENRAQAIVQSLKRRLVALEELE
jgi:DNA-binding NarL/FixJ family response regulator